MQPDVHARGQYLICNGGKSLQQRHDLCEGWPTTRLVRPQYFMYADELSQYIRYMQCEIEPDSNHGDIRL
jgi:hypothetical protein